MPIKFLVSGGGVVGFLEGGGVEVPIVDAGIFPIKGARKP